MKLYNKKGQQVYTTILLFFLAGLGLFILIGIFPAINPIIQSAIGGAYSSFTDLVLQTYIFFIVFFLILLIFIPRQVGQ